MEQDKNRLKKQVLEDWYTLKVTKVFVKQLQKHREEILWVLSSPGYLMSLKRPQMTCANMAGILELTGKILDRSIFIDALDPDMED